MERRAERRLLLAHFIASPPSHVKITWPPNAENDVGALDMDRIALPVELMAPPPQQRPGESASTVEWDLTAFGRSKRRKRPQASSVFVRGWKLFADRYPLRALPSFAEESLRNFDLLHPRTPSFRRGTTTRLLSSTSNNSNGSTPRHATSANTSIKPGSILHRRKASSPKIDDLPYGISPFSATTLTLAELAVCGKPSKQNGAQLNIPTSYPSTPVIDFICVANCEALNALEQEADLLNSLVYDHLLLSTNLFMCRSGAKDLATQILRFFKPALGISDAHHTESMNALATEQQKKMLEDSADLAKLKFRNVVVDDSEGHATLLAVWQRMVESNTDDAVESTSANAFKASRLLHICAAAGMPSTSDRLPPTVAALLFAGALQCVYYSMDPHTKCSVNEEDVQDVLAVLQRALGIGEALVPYCKLHALILAHRTLLGNTQVADVDKRAEAIQINFFERMAELLPFLNTKGLEDSPLTGFTMYEVYVLQEVVDATLALMEWFDSIDNEVLALSLCQAFCASCTALPQMFLSVHIRCNGAPLGCGKAVDSALMELLSHFVGAALLKELGDPEVWLDPSKPLSDIVALIDAACVRPTPFLKVFSEFLPQAEALVVPMFVRIVSYVFALYWGRHTREASSNAMPPQFLDGIRSLYFRVATKLPEDMRAYVGLLELIKESVNTSLGWLTPLYERHVTIVAESLNALMARNNESIWGRDDEQTDLALQKLFDCLQDAMIPLHFSIGTNLDAIHQRFLVVAISVVGRTAQHICGPYVLPSVEDQEKESPELFHGVSGPPPAGGGAAEQQSPWSTLPYYPLGLGVCKRLLIRALKLKSQLQHLAPVDALARMKYLNLLRCSLQTFVETFYVSVWSASFFVKGSKECSFHHGSHHHTDPAADASGAKCDDPGTSTGQSPSPLSDAPTMVALKSLVEEALQNINRFYGNIAEALALRVVHYGSLHHELHDKLLKVDLRFYRAHKHDKKFLMAEGRNAHLKPLHPTYTMDAVLDVVERELHAFVRHMPTAETIVRISAHIYAHLASVYAFLLLEGGDERFFYPEQSKDFLNDVEVMESFLTKNIPECSQAHGSGSTTLWEMLTTRDALESTRWWTAGNAVVVSLRTMLETAFAASSEDMVNGADGIPPFHALPELSTESAYCRYIVRRVLAHRKDPTAKKFSRSAT